MNADLSRATQGLGISSSVEHLPSFLRVPSLLLLCFNGTQGFYQHNLGSEGGGCVYWLV